MLGWFSTAAARASRRNRSCRSSSATTEGGRIFSATGRWSFSSSALYTTPIPPSPRRATIRKWESVLPIMGVPRTRPSPEVLDQDDVAVLLAIGEDDPTPIGRHPVHAGDPSRPEVGELDGRASIRG